MSQAQDIARILSLVESMSARIDTLEKAQAPAPKRTRKPASPQKSAPAPKKAAKPAVEKVTPDALLAALKGAPVGGYVSAAGLSSSDVNQTFSRNGGTWQPSAWADKRNDTYTLNGMTFSFDNVKVWRKVEGRTRGITRMA